MFFTLLVLVTALALESLGSYISVIGLSQNTSIIIIFLAILLDVVKVIIATTLYKKWNSLHLFLKVFLIPSLLGLMLVTSSGTYGYLIKEFGKTSVGQEQIALKVQTMQQEKGRIETRKKEIDSQVAALPANSFLQRKRLTELFSTELNQINSRILELDKAIPEANYQSLESKSTGGNLATIASTYGLKAEEVNKVVAFLITLMIDPLAIVLLTIANFLMEQHKKERRENARKFLNGELADDDDSIMLQLKEKMLFLKSKNPKESFEISSFFKDSKSQYVKKSLMMKNNEKVNVIDFIYSAKTIENPKIIVPMKYAASIFQLFNMSFFKESRPEIIKVLPKKSFGFVNHLNFITNVSEVLPSEVIVPLKLIRKEFLEEEELFGNQINIKPVNLPAQNSRKEIELINFIKNDSFVIEVEPFSRLKKEYLEEIMFISSDFIPLQPFSREIVKEPTTKFITSVKEIEIEMLKKVESNNVKMNIGNFISNLKPVNKKMVNSKQEAIVHDFLIKDKPNYFKLVQNETVSLAKSDSFKTKSFKKPMVSTNEPIDSKNDNSYSIGLEMPIEYDEHVIFHDDYEDFQIADLGDLVMELYEMEELKNSEEITGFDIKQILNMEEIII